MVMPFTFGRGAADGSALSTGEAHDYLRCAVSGPVKVGAAPTIRTLEVGRQVVTGAVVLITATGGRDRKSSRMVVLGGLVGRPTHFSALGNS